MRTLEDTGNKRDTKAIQARAQVRTALKDKELVADIMRQLAKGEKLKDIARLQGLDYLVLHRMLKANHAEDMAAARAAHAEDIAHRNLKLADDVEEGRVDPGAGKTASGIRQWYIERTDNETWGQKSSMNVTHKGVVGLHLEALRALTDQPLDGEIEEAEFEEISDEPEAQDEGAEARTVDENHPLL